MKPIDITGEKFNRLTAVRFAEVRKKKHFWEFLCECGIIKIIMKTEVKSGNTKSCGCFQKDHPARLQHGFARNGPTHRFYRIYQSMKERCNNPKDIGYHLYGAKGVKCFWQFFEKFRGDMLESYQLHVKEFGEKDTTIDRISGNGNYCKENCRWATNKEQQRNRSNNRLLTYKRETKCVAEWAEELGLDQFTIYRRLNSKWSTEKTLTEPVRRVDKITS